MLSQLKKLNLHIKIILIPITIFLFYDFAEEQHFFSLGKQNCYTTVLSV